MGHKWSCRHSDIHLPQGISLWKDNGVLVLYVADTNNHRIREIRNGIVSTLAGHKGLAPAPGYRDGTAIEARFDHPSGVATDDKGTTFVADTYNHLIRRIETDGTVTTAAGNTTHFYDGDEYDDTSGCHHHVCMEFQAIGMALYTMRGSISLETSL